MSVWLPTAPCTPGACVERAGSRAAVPRAVLRLTAVAVLLLTGIALSTPARRGIPAWLVGRWCRAIVRAAGVRVVTTGGAAPAEGGLLLVANHISWLDIPLLAAVRPARMLAKTEVGHWPVAGPVAVRSGAVLFIERDRLRALPAAVARIAEALRAGAAVAAFPEGSTWCGRARGRFHHAVFQAALDAGVPVQPVRLRYRLTTGAPTSVPAFVGEDTLPASLWRVTTTRHLLAEVEILPLILPGTHPDRRTLARAAAHAIDTAPGTAPPSDAPEPHQDRLPAHTPGSGVPAPLVGPRPVTAPWDGPVPGVAPAPPYRGDADHPRSVPFPTTRASRR
ncbi:lysophospholipid acyltransferase family protein [Streptomyces sp. NPDC047000]|uniref:lysophospholipid acyltransferase family protein n=1 Tax=Streptomyces sp. NPDC047000 TaxID=3155474 RepID=UPI00340D60AC